MSRFVSGNIDVCQMVSPIVASTLTDQNAATRLSQVHLIYSVSFSGSEIKYQDHFSPGYRQSGDVKVIIVDILMQLFPSIFH